MLGFIKKLFGDKSTRDLKEITPLVEATLSAFSKIDQLSNDELRAKTQELKNRINAYLQENLDEIFNLRQRTDEENCTVEEKEEIFEQIDRLEKDLNTKIEEILLEILPEAFAVVKSTAKRFNDNAEVEVSVMPWDEDLAAKRDSVNIRNGKAYYANEWMAGG
ncbi:MAG: preprotein translocase subunit SecA, partial [Bacteroidales bacterium]|nr:preprotein translocase subunit SecA [Bacteroidales bacterium]